MKAKNTDVGRHKPLNRGKRLSFTTGNGILKELGDVTPLQSLVFRLETDLQTKAAQRGGWLGPGG